jgi:galactokinase
MDERRKYLSEAFNERFGKSPSIWARAPGRVDLMGSHTDYNMGFVMTMTVDRDTWIAASPRDDNRISIQSCNVPGGATFSLQESIAKDLKTPWTNYVRGVAAVMQASGHRLHGFDGLIHSTIPFGSGLSSSAALEMAVACLLNTLGHLDLDPLTLALIGQKAENDFVGVNTGILDQYSSVMGQAQSALLLDCRQLTSETVPIHPHLQVVICNTRAERNLVGSEYDQRRAQCEEGVRILQELYPEIAALRDVDLAMFTRHRQLLPETIAKRCQFIVEENQRVLELAKALPAGQVAELGALFTASYQGARDLYEIGAPAMEAMMQAMTTAPGVVAARQAGAGFGGSMVALVEQGDLEPFIDQVAETYQMQTGIQPEIFAVLASQGAMIME